MNWSAAGSAFVALFQPATAGFLLLGVVIGLIAGLLPGLGGLFAISIMLPFALGLQPLQAFALLLSIHAVANTAGELTSILFSVPGEASSAAAILDGYPLTRQGQAGRAMGASLLSSLIGSIVGAVMLLLVIPVARPLILDLGNPELFMLIILGVTFVGSLTGGRPIVGYLTAALGFLLAMVGLDPQAGVPRYTFGMIDLWGGIPLIPVALGLFAVPTIFDVFARSSSIAEQTVEVGHDVVEGFRDTVRHWKLVLASGALGAFVGFIPGLGGSVAQWVSYGFARQRSKTPDRFGKGAIEGVIAPGAAVNSKEGGQLIPTLFFGVPGTAGMAVLLAALLIVGLTPGPQMLGVHLKVTFGLVWILILSHILAVGLCMIFLRHLAKVTAVPATYLVPVLTGLVFIGAYEQTGTLFGIAVMLFFGAVGYLMERLGWSRPVLILSFVLGKLAERYYFIAFRTYGYAWLHRPVVILIAVVVILQMVLSVLRTSRSRTGVPVGAGAEQADA